MANGPTKVVMEGVYTSNHPLGSLDVPCVVGDFDPCADYSKKKLVIGWGKHVETCWNCSPATSSMDTDRWGSLKIGYLGTPQNQLVDNGQLGMLTIKTIFWWHCPICPQDVQLETWVQAAASCEVVAELIPNGEPGPSPGKLRLSEQKSITWCFFFF